MASTEKTIGFIGIGRMGRRIAQRLIEAGHKLYVADADAEAVATLVGLGAKSSASAAEIAANTDVIFLSLPTPQVVDKVAFGPGGIAETSGAGKIVVDLSTTGPDGARALAKGLSARGYVVADSPVSGGIGGAEKGTLTLMVACEKALFEELLPFFETVGKPFLVGPEPGQGQMIKVLNNLVSVTALAITSEVLVVGTKAGLDPNVMVDVINNSSGQSNASMTKIPKFVLNRSFDFGFALELSLKDITLSLREGDAHNVPMLIGSAVRELLKITQAKCGPQADMTEIIRPIEEWAGVTVGDSAPAQKGS